MEVLLRQLRRSAGDDGLIFQAMQRAARQRGFDAVVQRLKTTEQTLPQLARGAAMAYAASGNFTVLHLVTSAHALRLLMPWIEDEAAALHAYWRAYAAAVCAADIRIAPPVPEQDWPALLERARASDDDHQIKLVYSCHEQQQALGEGAWRAAASRALAS